MTSRSAPPTVKITLIGLDRVGASLGLALRPREGLRLTGFDRDMDVAKQAQSRGIVHESKWNLLEAAAGADLVLLGGALADQPEWLKALAPELRQGAVVASLGPLLAPPLDWARAQLPAGRHFVAAHPILNPAYLHSGGHGLAAAQADLFTKGVWALAAAPECAPEALKLLGDLAGLVGARPYFIDPAEHDGLMAGVGAVPALAAYALLRAADTSSGWGEMRKVADRGFATATFALTEIDPAILSLNRENVLRYLDATLIELQALRELLARADRPGLEHLLAAGAERRAHWVSERERGEWEGAEPAPRAIPSFVESVGLMFTGGLFRRRDKPG